MLLGVEILLGSVEILPRSVHLAGIRCDLAEILPGSAEILSGSVEIQPRSVDLAGISCDLAEILPGSAEIQPRSVDHAKLITMIIVTMEH